MKSHQCLFGLRDLARLALPTLLVLAGLSAGLRIGHKLGWLPAVPISLDPETMVLAHQSLASHTGPPAEVIVTGDSTCLLGVDGLELSRALPGQARALNLALYIGLDLGVYGAVVSDFAAAHPGRVRVVVLLLTPTKLAGTATSEQGKAMWRQIQAAERSGEPPGKSAQGTDWLGAQLLREHVLSHWLATPLHGSGAAFFGFASEVDAYMGEHYGSPLSFGTFKALPGAARSEWTLVPEFEAETRAFRAQIPAGVKLCVGLTPGAAGASAPGEVPRRRALLEEWNRWMNADVLLTNLPPALPDVFFSGGGHMNAAGQKRFTHLLARELAPLLKTPQ